MSITWGHLTLINITEKLETAYWDFYYAQQTFLFETKSLNIAKQILDDAHKRLEQGKISVLEQQKASAELSKRESRLLDALGDLRKKQIDLLLLIASPTLLKEYKIITVHPNTNIEIYSPTDSISLYDTLINIHPNYLAKKYELDKRNFYRDSFKGERLPTINLIGSYGIRSRNDNANEAVSKFKSKKDRQSVLSGGVEIEIPLFTGYREKYIMESENLLIRASEIRLKLMTHYLIENSFILQKRIIDLAKQIIYEKKSVEYHKKELQEEFIKLNVGKSNLNIIFEKEEDLRVAQKKELEIICQFHLHLIQLEKSKGSLLLKNKLETYKDNSFSLRNDLL
ncbi:MAG TPA: TolC family protein [Edaphocola sp.]|nr:TolC family protein [Edaphocola sp.]